ncbi:MAG: tryptophan-rich sensory protein, partial [Clostridia bacterium]|nr:tryptophan-rich sensory protein [Clostridia bacterium]
YALMGVACYLVWISARDDNEPLYAYGIQLFMNFFWSILFFGVGNTLAAFIWLVLLFGAVVWTAVLFFRTRRAAGWLLVPYILWIGFALYLNLGVYLLNR